MSYTDNLAVRDLARTFSGRASAESEAGVGASFDARIEACIVAAEAGEAALAFEDLVSNLHEFDVDLGMSEYDALQRIAVGLAIPGDRWDFLAEQVHP